MALLSNIKTISVLGCGWLGLPLAEQLVAMGFTVKGSTTTEAKLPLLKAAGIMPYLIKLLPEPEGDSLTDFLETDVLILNVPPSRFANDMEMFHPTQVQHIIEIIEKNSLENVIFISSTSVYPEINKIVDETDIDENIGGNKAILMAENLLLTNPSFRTTVLRMGGLMGKNRIPVKYFAGKKVKNGDNPVNYIHLTDAVRVIIEVIKQDKWHKVYNAVAPLHPTRKEVYTQAAKALKLALPDFIDDTAVHYKIVSSEKLIGELNYQFVYPNPLDFDYEPLSV
jgi:nucleoside-diphosphate-sugar epimerase